MTSRRARRSGAPRISAELREGEVVKPLELFFDLVFVLGFTQCTALMEAQPTWEGVGRAMLVLAVLWWAWVGYAWLTSVIEPEEGAVRIVIFAATAGLLVVALCVPDAFGDRALLFAVAYGVVRAAHIALFLIASRDDPALRRSVVGLAVSSAIAVGLLVGASFLSGGAQESLWAAAILLDWGGPGVFGTQGWKLVPGHFAERHSLVIILALGESIVSLGVGAKADLTVGVVTAAVLGVALAAALWWTYFDVVALVNARRLTMTPEGRRRNALARDSYSYLHFPMVAGIVLAAFGLEETLAHVDDALEAVAAFALLGGVAIYLLAHVALRLRNAHTINRQRLVLAVGLFALIPVATVVPAIVAVAGVDALLWAVIAYETANYDERRYRLRHGLDPDPEAPLGGERTPGEHDDHDA
ncbi:MAG TPA: low temperature requirement protein A [Acidimicrobiia bacterium]|nr:low temperature requirement protein A [Acidimicrobiia bacterium]